MTKLISSITGTKNVIFNIVAVLFISFIAFTLLAVTLAAFSDVTILNRAF